MLLEKHLLLCGRAEYVLVFPRSVVENNNWRWVGILGGGGNNVAFWWF